MPLSNRCCKWYILAATSTGLSSTAILGEKSFDKLFVLSDKDSYEEENCGNFEAI